MKYRDTLLTCALAIALSGGALNAQVPTIGLARLGQLRTASGGNLSSNNLVADPTVIFDGGKYRMWYTAVAKAYTSQQVMGIGYAESLNGSTWVPRLEAVSGDPILVVRPTPGGWDHAGVETPSVIRAPNGKYLMYYSGDQSVSSHYWAIGLAQSNDGSTWMKVGTTPILAGSKAWDGPFLSGSAWVGGACEPSVVYDPVQKLFKMWYAGFGLGGDFVRYSLGYATSTDGIKWTRRAAPVLTPGLSGSWDDGLISQPHVVFDPKIAGYHMFYFAASAAGIIYADVNATSSISGALGYAYSKDGITWQKRNNPALNKLSTAWEGWTIGAPAALVELDTIKLWYHGFSSQNSFVSGLGLATSLIPR